MVSMKNQWKTIWQYYNCDKCSVREINNKYITVFYENNNLFYIKIIDANLGQLKMV